MKILVINGPNLNLLGLREPELYGNDGYSALKKICKVTAKEQEVKVKVVQSNHEGKLVCFIQNAYKRYDGLVINAGAYTHTSIAILDALKAVSIPTCEVHITDINAREDFRKLSYVGMYAQNSIVGKGLDGYKLAIEYLSQSIKE